MARRKYLVRVKDINISEYRVEDDITPQEARDRIVRSRNAPMQGFPDRTVVEVLESSGGRMPKRCQTTYRHR